MTERATDRERRLLQVFGDVLPDVTTDDVGDHEDVEQVRDRWLLDNRPPHHEGSA